MKQLENYCKQRGSFIVESIWLWPILVMLTLGVVQMGFLYNAKATMNNATFQAAREGSIKHGDGKAMEKRLAETMAPLYIKDASLTELVKQRAILSAAMKLPAAPIGDIQIISPTKSIYEEFKTTQYYLDRKGIERGIVQMPSDNLNVRSSSQKLVKTPSGNVNINLQDANLLKIRGHWCYEMIVPFVNYIIYQTYASLPGAKSPHWGACRALSFIRDSYYLPVSATSVVRMQTPIRW
ncbi:TadE-like protein [Marinobacter daqiaonensis]|uniref:TadE-like protein n=1 Tax=Marinobacter daqiaonensis TaxID=650891 RepID=A0A1I6I7K2_9GAMM|nr:TadE family protein [Marinobacter daqiaonensis]SFR62683.1 TadE-like protein [Marinobacter daqiaonensis]